MEERRQYIRISKSLIVAYQRVAGVFRVPCHSVDISEGGIRLAVSQRIERGALLKLWIQFEGITKPIELVGEVVWLKEKVNAKMPFEIGLKFIEINPEDRNKLSEYIHKISNEEELEKIRWIG